MNERIKQLAKDYLLHERFTRYGESIQEDYYEMYPDELEKFTALIVKECIDKIETYKIYVGNSAAGELACEWAYDALKEIRDDIKETFGVEE